MKYQWSETFLSIEGEGPYTGNTVVYIRFTGCNFSCSGFNNPQNVDPSSPEILKFDPRSLSSIDQIPSINIGCDSIYAWHKSFNHLWYSGDETQLADNVVALLPVVYENQWVHPKTNHQVILSLTGGEPTLKWKTIPGLLNHPQFNSLRHVLIETNCSVKFPQSFVDSLQQWADLHNGKITWSNSPKLLASGEPLIKAVRPDIAMLQRAMCPQSFTQYFKFVCGDNDAHFDEVSSVMEMYYAAGIPRDVGVYIMPESCTEQQQQAIMISVADRCLQRGFIYCHRVHNTVYSNAIGK